MTKKDLITAIAEKSGLSKKDSEAALAAFIATVEEQLKAGESVHYLQRIHRLFLQG